MWRRRLDKMASSIVERVIENFVSQTDKVAIQQQNINKTYRDLQLASQSIASYLLKNGLNKGDRVALLIENSFEYVAAYYGVLLSGGVVVALNSAAKSNDLCNWISHSGASWLFTIGKNPEIEDITVELSSKIKYVVVGKHKIKSNLNIESFESVLTTVIVEKFPVLLGEDNATIIYTSGTTGQPKGVTLTHTNLLANMESILEYMPVVSNDRCLNVLPFYYSYGNSVLHIHMMAGATIVLENSFVFPHVVLKKMQDEKITSFSGVPSTYALLLNRTKLSDFDLSSIRYMTQAGGAMLPAHIEQLRSYLPDVEFIVMYGQTEATARLAYLPYDQLDEKMSSAGKAIPGVTLEIRDNQGKKLPLGGQGEIYASGKNIMKCYWNDEKLTSTVLFDGWLKTGDLASQDDDGFIYIIGRKTEMIKSGAHRISPLDIEESILRCNGVGEVAVIGKKDEILGQVIKAFIVSKENVKLEKRDIQRHCKKSLAAYKIPKFIEFIDELPKTASGKLKRFELEDLY